MTFRKKIALITFGFSLSILILEIGLRLTGYLMISAREVPLGVNEARESFLVSKEESGKIKIMTLGDSTTNGGTMPLENTYPFLLFNLLEKSIYKDKTTVANHGRCEYNTSMTLNQIKSELDDYDPEIVILLTGEADRFNPQGLEESFKEEAWSNESFFKAYLLKFRVYKLIRGIVLNMKYK